MAKFSAFLAALLLTAFWTAAQQVAVVYPRPMRYGEVDGRLLAEVTLLYKGPGAGLSIELAGRPLTFVADGDSLRTRVPLFGKPEILVFKKDGRVISEQEFTPYIPDDWDYFGNGTIDIISSSHQDIAWMNTPDSCRMERIDKIILPAMHLMQESPEFRFGMEQTLNLMELIRQDPANEKEILPISATGHFGWGATFNQPYEGLESSEQLVRELYLGRKWLLDNFNGRIDARTAFSVDVPGRTLQFPQILARAGVRHLFISRFKEGFYNWYSPDGSKILTYSPGNYGWAVMFYKYFDIDAPAAMHKLHEVLRNWNAYYANRHIPPHYAVVISNDASGPVFYKQVLTQWNRLVDESGLAIPRLRYTTADQFLDEVDVPGVRFDSISGERPNLWLYIHGPAHYEAIAAKRAAAVHLPASEMFNSIDGLLTGNFNNYPRNAFDTAWYKSIYPDHGWGGKHGDITDSIYRSYLEAGDSIARATLFPALRRIAARVKTSRENPVVVFNDLSWDRDAPAILPVEDSMADCSVRDAQGRAVPSQVVNTAQGRGLAIIAEKVPAIGYTTYYLSRETASPEAPANAPTPPKAQPTPPNPPENAYENEYYRIRFGDGGIKELYDKQLRQDLLNTTRFSGGDVLDLGYDGLDAGEFTEITPANMRDFDKLSNHVSLWSRVSDGPVFTTFECRYLLGQDSVIQRIIVYRRLKKIDFEYELPYWKGIRSRQLSFALPLNTPDARISYDVPMGIASVHGTELQMRPEGWAWGGTYYQKPEEIHPRESQNFVTAETRDFGFTLSSRLAVFDWIDPTRESVSYPVLQAVLLTTQKSCHGEGPWYEQRGRHIFRLSISSHLPGLAPAMAFGMSNNHELYCVKPATNETSALPQRLSFFRSDAPGTLITAIKKADNGDNLILRLVNMERRSAVDNIVLFRPVEKWQKVDLIEEPGGRAMPGGNVIRLPMGPATIQTLSVTLIK